MELLKIPGVAVPGEFSMYQKERVSTGAIKGTK